ncbi:MAG TPA: M56 family metallopeptidase [Longimicrobiales bacterium]
MGVGDRLFGSAAAPGVWVPLLAEVVAKGTVLLLLVYLAALLLRRASAGLRHLVWSAGLAGVLALPLAVALPWRLEVLPVAALQSGEVDAGVASGGGIAFAPGAREDAAPVAAGAVAAERSRPAPRGAAADPRAAAERSASRGELPAGEVSLAAEATLGAPGGDAGSVRGALVGPWRDRVLLGVITAWAAGAAAFLLYILFGAVGVRRIARRAVPLDSPAWTTPLYEAADRLELGDVPRLLRSDEVALPFTYGLLRPTIVLPGSAEAWSGDRRRAVLFHELGHVRRMDLLSHLVGRIACALYWFHPLVWLAARRARAECERACDDLVLTAGTRASAYADHLLQIVSGAARTSAPAVAIPMAQRKEFEGRMLAILEPGVRRGAPSRAQATMVATVLAALTLSVAAAAPARTEAAPPELAGSADPSTAPGDDGIAAQRPVAPPPAAPPDTDRVGRARSTRAAGAGVDTAQVARAESLRAAPAAPDPVARGASLGSARADAPRAMPADTDHVASRHYDHAGEVWFGDGARPMPMPTPAPTPMLAPAPMPAPVDRVDEVTDAVTHQFWRGWQRKAQPGDSVAVAALIAALRDSIPSVRAAAVYALGEIGDPRAVPALAAVVRSDSDAEVRRGAVWALGEIGDPAAVPALGAAAASDDADIARMAVWALGEIGDPAAVPALAAALRNSDAEVRSHAAWALGEVGEESAVTPLAAALDDAIADVRRMAAWALGEVSPDRAPSALVAALTDGDAEVRKAAAWALGEVADPAAAPALAEAIEDENEDVRRTALWALGEIGGEPARDALLRAIRSEDPEIRRMAARALARTY